MKAETPRLPHSHGWIYDPLSSILSIILLERILPDMNFDEAGFNATVKQFKDTVRWFEGGRRQFERFDTGVIGAEESYEPRIQETSLGPWRAAARRNLLQHHRNRSAGAGSSLNISKNCPRIGE